jgi:SAM-dependent methyltransferase
MSRKARAGSFGLIVDDYERGRPGYPDEAIAWLLEDANRIIDLGAGTGKLTAQIGPRADEVVAIEPQELMVKRLRERVAGAHPVRAGAEALPVRGGWADAVVVGQAFHWFDQERAVPEIARSLAPGGRLGLIWNVRDVSVDWVADLGLIAGSDNSTEIRKSLPKDPRFGPFEFRHVPMVQKVDRDSLLALVRSRSNVATLSEKDRGEVIAAVVNLCETHQALKGRDRYEFPYVTEVYRATKAE